MMLHSKRLKAVLLEISLVNVLRHVQVVSIVVVRNGKRGGEGGDSVYKRVMKAD